MLNWQKNSSPTYVPLKLVDSDGSVMLMTVTLHRHITDRTTALKPALDQIRQVLDSSLADSMSYRLAGYPALPII